jgi:hypothetical protein
MNRILEYIPIFFWIIAVAALLIGLFNSGYQFVQSRGAILCLSCMGLEENEDF